VYRRVRRVISRCSTRQWRSVQSIIGATDRRQGLGVGGGTGGRGSGAWIVGQPLHGGLPAANCGRRDRRQGAGARRPQGFAMHNEIPEPGRETGHRHEAAPAEPQAGRAGFIAHPTRYLFFTGKGGVAKTSLSTATALALADGGRRMCAGMQGSEPRVPGGHRLRGIR
jgi:hypothetical protein